MNFKQFLEESTTSVNESKQKVYLKQSEWKDAATKRGAVKFNKIYPDITAVDSKGIDVGFWDGTDSTGTLDKE